MRRLVLIALLLLTSPAWAAPIDDAAANAFVKIRIPFHYGANRDAEVPTVFWAKPDSKAVLIFLPGGNGSFGLSAQPAPRPLWLLADLYQSGKPDLDLVYMDSEISLQGESGDTYQRWAPRREARHIEGIQATINYYRQKTGKPVFLLGHSNGSFSIAEFLSRAPENPTRLAGLIFSGMRNETEVKQKLSIPVLVRHHRSDPNRWTTPGNAEKFFSTLKQNNASVTKLAWVEGGKDVPGGDPTHSGRHMYFEATPEAAITVRSFIGQSMAN